MTPTTTITAASNTKTPSTMIPPTAPKTVASARISSIATNRATIIARIPPACWNVKTTDRQAPLSITYSPVPFSVNLARVAGGMDVCQFWESRLGIKSPL